MNDIISIKSHFKFDQEILRYLVRNRQETNRELDRGRGQMEMINNIKNDMSLAVFYLVL